MSDRPQLVRTVFSELLDTLGKSFSHTELLESANSIVDVVIPISEKDDFNFSLRAGGLPFDQWALDACMRDGGWRVLNREADFISDLYEDDCGLKLEEFAINDWILENCA